jgi:hypothetical protein
MNNTNQVLVGDDTKLIGFSLPMLPSEARHKIIILEGVVKDKVEYDSHEVSIYDAGFRKENCSVNPLFFDGSVWSKTFIYCKYPGISELRKELLELSDVDLRKVAEASWGITSRENGKKLIQEIVDVFVRQELNVDFKASVEFANRSTREYLYRKILPRNSEPKLEIQKGRIDVLLTNEGQWLEVKSWVNLFRKRIQGRSKKGLEELWNEQSSKITEFNLDRPEVLGAYLYTGPCFMAYNGIYRKFPVSITELLKGDDETSTPANTMPTTLFCLSSALIKLGRHTKLPENGKVYRGMGAMHLPQQFWVPRGNPEWKGGVERAIMSTTTDKEVAVFYSSGKGIVAEISVGRVQMGGDMGWISMVT